MTYNLISIFIQLLMISDIFYVLLYFQINHNRPWRSNSLTPPTPRQSEDCQVSQCDMMSNFGVWSGTGGSSNYKLRSHSLTVLKNGQIRDEVEQYLRHSPKNCCNMRVFLCLQNTRQWINFVQNCRPMRWHNPYAPTVGYNLTQQARQMMTKLTN